MYTLEHQRHVSSNNTVMHTCSEVSTGTERCEKCLSWCSIGQFVCGKYGSIHSCTHRMMQHTMRIESTNTQLNEHHRTSTFIPDVVTTLLALDVMENGCIAAPEEDASMVGGGGNGTKRSLYFKKE